MKVTGYKQGSGGRVVASGYKDLNTKTETSEIGIFPKFCPLDWWWLLVISIGRYSFQLSVVSPQNPEQSTITQ